MIRLFFAVVMVILADTLASGHCWAATDFSKVRFVFLSANESQTFLATPDEYTAQLSPLDLSLYHSTKETISIAQHLEFLKSTPLEWKSEEKEALLLKIESFIKVVSDLNLTLSLPSEVLLVKTNGEDAFHSHYTRRNGIIFPADASGTITTDLGTFYHEMFHIMSRNHPSRMSELFALIGFSPIARLSLPASLESIRTTNPDAFFYEHAVTVLKAGEQHQVVAFMYSAIKQEDINGPVDESQIYKLGLLDLASLNEERPLLYKVAETNYKDVVKANTLYYIHPEEIMAEDFKLLLLQKTPGASAPAVKYQSVLDQLQSVLSH